MNITDLRSALKFLESQEGELIETNTEVDLNCELAGVYKLIGAGGTLKRPTRIGPAMLFNTIKGHPNAKVLIGLLSRRKRVGKLLGIEPHRLGWALKESVNNPIQPIEIDKSKATCQEVVHLASDKSFDLNKLLPTPTTSVLDAGPFVTLGMCYASHPDTGLSDITIHRLCIQSKDELSIFFTPGIRHIGAMAQRANELGKPLPISVSIGVDPAIEIATCFEPPTTPLGYNELAIAGALRNKPVEMVQCISINESAIANAEYVIEGEILPGITVPEDKNTGAGYAMPEFPGYTGEAYPACPIIKVKAITHRKNPIMQTCIGPSEEHVSMAGIPTEASIIDMVERSMPGRLLNVYMTSSGGGKYMAVMQFIKREPSDEGRQRQAALTAFTAFPELKHVIIVDEDVDIFDMDDVLWAMNTRYQGDKDTIFIPGVRCHPLDPSQSTAYNPENNVKGISCKTIFDCTVPFHLKDKFKRSEYMNVDLEKFLPNFKLD